MTKLAISAMFVLFAGVGLSCSKDAASSGKPCTAGETVACACPGGSSAMQTCDATGAFGACACAGGGAGTGAGVGVSAGAGGAIGAAGIGSAGAAGVGVAGTTAGAAGSAGDGSAGTAAGGGAAGTGNSMSGGKDPTMLPTHKQACPTITEGDVMFLGHKVKVWVGADGKSKLGPLVIYWHGTCSSPIEALAGIGMNAINEIKAQGGMVAAIYSEFTSPSNFCGTGDTGSCTGATSGNGVWCDSDYDTADEIVACAIEQVGIDTHHIHTAGMSAGGLQTVAMSYARSGYLASITSYSGGVTSFNGMVVSKTTSQDPTNKFAAMIVDGGDNDMVVVNFKDNSIAYQNDLKSKGQFSFICDHGMGHTIPAGIGDSTWKFFQDHPFNVSPEPYVTMLPATFPSYCKLP